MRTKRSAVEAISYPLGQERIFRRSAWVSSIKMLNETRDFEHTCASPTAITVNRAWLLVGESVIGQESLSRLDSPKSAVNDVEISRCVNLTT